MRHAMIFSDSPCIEQTPNHNDWNEDLSSPKTSSTYPALENNSVEPYRAVTRWPDSVNLYPGLLHLGKVLPQPPPSSPTFPSASDTLESTVPLLPTITAVTDASTLRGSHCPVPTPVDSSISSMSRVVEPRTTDSTTASATPHQYTMISCWQRWWQTVCSTACVRNKTGHLQSDLSSTINCLRFPCCCYFSGCSQPRCRCRVTKWSRRRLPNENLLILSIIQILCGFAAIILSSVALTKTVFLYYIAAGMWAGLLMLFTGTQGLIAARRPIACTLVGLLIFCLLVTLAACALICISVAGIIEDGFLDRYGSKTTDIQHRHVSKLTSSLLPHQQQYPEPVDRTSIFNTRVYIHRFDQLPMKLLNGTHFYQWGQFHDRHDSKQRGVDAYLRTCQVILHVLLLLVGIMESSVSLSTSAICYKCLYLWYMRSHATNNSGITTAPATPLHTNIVSFNADAANQAVAVLQSHDMQQFTHAGGVLLAVDTNSEPSPLERPDYLSAPGNLSFEPCLHHTAAPFLSDRSTGNALILTEASAGSSAWTAARAAAALINRNRLPTLNTGTRIASHSEPVYDLDTVRNPFFSFFSRRNRVRELRRRLARQNARPHLLFTSLPPPSQPLNPQCRSSPSNEDPATNERSTNQPKRRTTLLYVMPSPSREEPPIIFPPFPPPYSDLQRRPSANPFRCSISETAPIRDLGNFQRSHHRRQRSRASQRGQTQQQTRRGSDNSLFHLRRIFCNIFPNYCNHRHLTSNLRRVAHIRASVANTNSNSALICAGDRILQPVLIVEDGDSVSNPPTYSTLDLNASGDHSTE